MIRLARRVAFAAVVAVVILVGLAMMVATPPLILVIAIGISDSAPAYPLLVWLESLGLPWLIYGLLAMLAVRGVRLKRVVMAVAPALVLACGAGAVAAQVWPGLQRWGSPSARQITVAPTRT